MIVLLILIYYAIIFLFPRIVGAIDPYGIAAFLPLVLLFRLNKKGTEEEA